MTSYLEPQVEVQIQLAQTRKSIHAHLLMLFDQETFAVNAAIEKAVAEFDLPRKVEEEVARTVPYVLRDAVRRAVESAVTEATASVEASIHKTALAAAQGMLKKAKP
jgi:hypothetical protein